MRTLETEECFVVKYEPFAKFASRWDLLPGRVVIPGSAGVPPAPDLAGRWRLASQTWSVHRMTGTGQQLYKNAGGTPALPGGNQRPARCRSIQSLQIMTLAPHCHARLRILQKAQILQVVATPHLWKTSSLPCGGDPHTPFSRARSDQTSIKQHPPKPQAARAAPSERKSQMRSDTLAFNRLESLTQW